MVEHITSAEASTKASPGSDSGVRKFTLSCSRCRASKLKCDQGEPCMECVKRNIGHLCTKDERRRRAKKAKTNHDDSSISKPDPSQLPDQEVEEAAQVLEHFVDGTSRINAYPSTALGSESSLVAPDYPNTYWLNINDQERQRELLALIREVVDSMPELDVLHTLHEVFITRCQGPLGNTVYTPTFMRQAEGLCGCLGLDSAEAQVLAISSTFSMDTIACHLLALLLGLAFHPTPSLLGWSSTPLNLRVEELRASDAHAKTWRSLALRCLHGEVSIFCGSIASLQAAVMLLLDGQEEPLTLDAILVTAISGAQKLCLHRIGDAGLKAFSSPSSSSADSSSTSTEPAHIRTEVGVRIWWALVMRDWSKAQNLGYYSIHPSQFNTRMPLHINDDDLCPTTLKIDVHGNISERPRSEFTMLSYTIHALEIASFARESIVLRGPLHLAERQKETKELAKARNHLNKKYESFVAGLPPYFRLGSTMGLTSIGPLAAIPVQRWMLHRQLWSLLLRLHRANISSSDSRASCQQLAQNIISTHAQIQARCAVCGSLSTNETQLFNAAIALLVELLFSSKYRDADCSSAQLSRLMTRDNIREAIDLLQARSGAERSSPPLSLPSERVEAHSQRSIMALEALMKLEEDELRCEGKSNGENATQSIVGGKGCESGSRMNRSLKNKVVDILSALEGNAKNADLARGQASSYSLIDPNMSMLQSPDIDGIQDLDVLPILSNDANGDFWQFLDFSPHQSPTEIGSFSATADLQTIVGSTPFMPSSGMTHSLSSFGITDTADVYRNPDGTLSPLSFESQLTLLSRGS